MMLSSYLPTFCRVAVGLTSAISFVTKVEDAGQFTKTIRDIHLLPKLFAKMVAALFLSGEAAVFLLLNFGA